MNTAAGYAPGLPIEMQISTKAPFSFSERKIKEFNRKYVKFIWIKQDTQKKGLCFY